MTVWEIKNKSGLSDENINFYKKEGLFCPKYEKTGYRDYTETDLNILLRIKLLRQLGISIDRIKLLQAGKTELTTVLDERLSESSSSFTETNQQTVCKTIKEDEAKYSDLEAQKYFEKLEEFSNKITAAHVIEEDVIRKLRYPWRRYFARTIDFGIYILIWYFILYVIIGSYPVKSNVVLFFSTYVVFTLMIFIEPLLLSRFGTTLGKWIFGLSLTDVEGRKPSYSMGISRAWDVFAKGYGYNIPIYSIVRNYKSYKACEIGELPWDEGFAYSIRDTKIYRSFVFIAVYAIIISASIFFELNAEMPKNRGEISAAEFAQNYNQFMNYIGDDSGRHLRANGTFEEEQNNIISYIYNPPKKLEINEENGVVTRVAFEVETDADNPITEPTAEMMAAEMSYVAAQPEMNCFKLRSDGILNRFKNNIENSFQSFEFTSVGVKSSCSVEYRGYNPSSEYLIPIEGEKRYYHLVFTMEKVE